MATKTFNTKVLRTLLDCDEDADTTGYTVVQETLVGSSRWSLLYDLIFTAPEQEPGTAWRARYSSGATESQDETPFQYRDTVAAELVRLKPKELLVWVGDDTNSRINMDQAK